VAKKSSVKKLLAQATRLSRNIHEIEKVEVKVGLFKTGCADLASSAINYDFR